MSLQSRFSTECDLLKREVYKQQFVQKNILIEELAFYITKAKEIVRKQWN